MVKLRVMGFIPGIPRLGESLCLSSSQENLWKVVLESFEVVRLLEELLNKF
jgi:hypothetical protein